MNQMESFRKKLLMILQEVVFIFLTKDFCSFKVGSRMTHFWEQSILQESIKLRTSNVNMRAINF